MDKLKKEIKGLKEQKKVWQDIVQVTKVGNLLKEKSKLLSEIQEMKEETHAGRKESTALTNKKVQQKRVLPSPSRRYHPGTSKSLQNKSTKVQSMSMSQHSTLKVQMLEENKGTKRKINYEMDTKLNINNMEWIFNEMEGGRRQKLTDYEDYEEKQEAQRAKWRMYKRNQRLKDLDKEEVMLEERRMQIRVQKKAIKELGD